MADNHIWQDAGSNPDLHMFTAWPLPKVPNSRLFNPFHLLRLGETWPEAFIDSS